MDTLKVHYRIIWMTDSGEKFDMTCETKVEALSILLGAVSNRNVEVWTLLMRDPNAPEEEGWDSIKGWARSV